MQRMILFLLLLVSAAGLTAQHMKPQVLSDLRMPKVMLQHPDGSAPQVGATPDIPLSDRGFGAELVGPTFFDQQTYGSMGKRFHSFADGRVSATWLYGQTFPDFPDRGTGFNHFSNGSWDPWPTSRAEGNTRTGFPSFAVTNDETEFIFSHKIPSGTWEIGIFSKDVGSSTWTEASLPTGTTGGLVWPKVAVGGADDQTIHLLAITLPTAFGGVIYEGLEQHLLYYRSQDAGATWDVQDFIIPGLDSTYYRSTDTEAYAIDASGETVAVSVFSQWGDVAVFKSTDNGDTWNRHLIHDFPLDKYDGSGYTSDDIPFDPDAPSETAILTADNAGTVLIDDNDQLHVWFGLMYVEAQDSSFFYFPGASGIFYWNESFGEDSLQIIADLEDLNNNGTLDITDFGTYFTSLTSNPTAGLGADGEIYLAYSAVNEEYLNTSQNQNYRNIFIIRSEDGGASWSAPFNLIYEAAFAPTFSTEFECVYPQINRHVNDRLQLLLQQDFSPGMASNPGGDGDPYEANTIFFVEYNSSDFSPISTGVVVPEGIADFTLLPNPTAGPVTLQYYLTKPTDVQVEVYDATGRLLQSIHLGNQQSGRQTYELNWQQEPGIYLIELRADAQRWTEKVIIRP